MNSDSNSPSSSPRRSWTWIVGVSFIVAALSSVFVFLFPWPPSRMLAALFAGGAAAGAISTRQAWLSGIIVGLPLSLLQFTRTALEEFGFVSAALAHPDYWRLVVPVSVVSTAIAILGALTGAWLFGARFRPR